jgi:hypothetical protein
MSVHTQEHVCTMHTQTGRHAVFSLCPLCIESILHRNPFILFIWVLILKSTHYKTNQTQNLMRQLPLVSAV